MAATQWYPRTLTEQPRQWLLGNGEIVSEPTLEMTSTGRKVRVPNTNLSAFTKDLDDLVKQAVESIARSKQTDVWMSLHERELDLQRTVGFDPSNTKAKLFTVASAGVTSTTVWWRFKHPTLPIEALLFVNAHNVTSHQPQNGQMVTTSLTMQKANKTALRSDFQTTVSGWFNPMVETYSPKREFVRDNPPEWDAQEILGQQRVGNEQQMVKVLLDKVRAIEELDSIEIPDLREGHDEWITLDLYETNVNSEFMSDLIDYLEGNTTIQDAIRIYGELRDCLRGIGLYLNELSENDFNRGLLGGEDSYVSAAVRPVSAPLPDAIDQEHSLFMHIPTGTFSVACSHRAPVGAALDRWEEAKAIASLTGEEDELLAFAREEARRINDERNKALLKERKQHA